MRKFPLFVGIIFLSCFLLSAMIPFPLAVSQPYPIPAQTLGDSRLSFVQGDVVVQTEATGSEWGAAVINTPLVPGTKIWDPENGRSEIQFFDGSYLRSSANTEVDITNLNLSPNGDVIQAGIPQGRVYVNDAGSGAQNSVFQLDTPVASVMSYGASRFDVKVYQDGYTEVSVFNGRVNVQNQIGSTTVDAGNMLSVDLNQVGELSPMRPEDAWISWNLSRDSALAHRGPSRSYLPTSLIVYGNDLDSYGRWIETSDYGYVWTPLNTPADWAPYRIGRWCWIGGEYVWVSYEPWGWAPYHYGRWAFLASRGWCWVPPQKTDTAYWSPGYVAWVQTPTYLSWVPLAPGEIYYGRGYYGPHSIDVNKTDIHRTHINDRYANAGVRNAVTVLSREAFLTGRHVSRTNLPANPFHGRVKVAPGGPDIKPARATALPDPVKVVPKKVLPPKEVMSKTVQVERRPAAVQRNVSVFKPGERVVPMQTKKVERPANVVRQHELRQPSTQQKGEVSRPSAQTEAGKPRVQQRQFGVAPPHNELNTPRAGKEQNKPSAPNAVKPGAQQSQSVAPNKGRINTAPNRGEVSPPSAQKGEKAAPPVHREFGSTPQHGGQSVIPPAAREPTSRPSPPNMVKPQTQRPQSVAPNREKMNTAPLPVQRGQTGGSAVQRQTGSAPPHNAAPPAVKEPMNRPSAPSVVAPQAPRPQAPMPNTGHMSTPPNRREVSPAPAQGGSSLQRQMGAAPPHVGSAVAPPAHPQAIPRPPVQSTTKQPAQRKEVGR